MTTSFITLSDLYLTVPFEEKEEAKEKWAKWDRKQKLWHVSPGLDPLEFRNWWSFLGPAFKDRERLKKMGARYHRGLKSWYVPRDTNSKLDYDDFKEWWPDDCKTVRRWIKTRELPAAKLGSQWRIRPRDVDLFIHERMEQGSFLSGVDLLYCYYKMRKYFSSVLISIGLLNCDCLKY